MSKDRLVSVRSLVCAFRHVAMVHATEAMNAEGTAKGVLNEYLFNIENNIADLLENGDLGVTVDAVPREEHELLVRRLEHLLESDYIRSFDEVRPITGKYKRNIRGCDAYIARLEARVSRWIPVTERLPVRCTTCLVTIQDNLDGECVCYVDAACFDDEDGGIDGLWNTFHDWDEGQEIHVTHWMPLPSAAEEVSS